MTTRTKLAAALGFAILGAAATARATQFWTQDQNAGSTWRLKALLAPASASEPATLHFVTPGAGYLKASGTDGTISATATIPGSDVSLTATQVGFGSGSSTLTGESFFTWDSTAHRLHVGTVAPDSGMFAQINIITESVGESMWLSTNATSIWNEIVMDRSGGSRVSPTAVPAGDAIWDIASRGYTGAAGYKNSLIVGAAVPSDGTVSSGVMPQVFFVSTSTTGGNTNTTVSNRALAVTHTRNVFLGEPSIATTATDGFPYFPAAAGPPTGVPTYVFGGTQSLNRVPLYVDNTNARLYSYIGGAWRYASFDSGNGAAAITALTGDVTATGPGSVAATIAANAVAYAKMQDVSAASRLLGRGSAAGAGDPQEISLGSGLSMSGTTLSASGSGGTVTSVSGTSGRISSTGGNTPVIDLVNTAVTPGSYTYASLTVDAAGRLTAASSGAAPEVPLTFSTGLTRTANTITANLSTGISGGQFVYGGVAGSENLGLSSTANASKGQIQFGSSTNVFDEPTQDFRFGGGPWLGVLATEKVLQFSRNFDGPTHVVATNNSAGTSANAGYVLSLDNTVSSVPYAALSLFGTNYSAVSAFQNSVVLELGQSTGDIVISNLASSAGGIRFKTTGSRTDRLTIANGGTVTISSLGSGLVKSTSGALANASASDIATALTMPAIELIPFSGGTTAPLSSDTGWAYDTGSDTITISGGDSFALYNLGSRTADTNYERMRVFRSSNVFHIDDEKKGSGLSRALQMSWTAGVTIDEVLSVNGPTPLSNSAFQVGHTTAGNRDHVQFYLGGGGAQDTASNTFFDIVMAGTTIGTGSNGGIQATARIHGFTLTGSGGPTPAEATGLYIDGPTLSGVTAPVYAIHTGVGSVAINDLGTGNGGYVAADTGTGKLVITTPSSDLTYYVELTSGMITTINAADQYIATSSHDTLFAAASIPIEYPVAGTLPLYTQTSVCIVGTNTITSGAMNVDLTVNGSGGVQATLNSSSTGCVTNVNNNFGGAVTDTFGVLLHGGGGGPAVSGTLRLAIKVKMSPQSLF